MNDDGEFTTQGLAAMTRYANAWLRGSRDLGIERAWPDLAGTFYDLRANSDYARRYADAPLTIMVKSRLTLTEAFQKAGLAENAPQFVVKANG